MHNLMIIFSIVLIEIIQPKVNLGTIKEGDLKKVVFKIKNNSTKPTKIYSVSTSCSCTAPSYPDKIPPKSTVDVVINFDSKGIKGSFERNIVLVLDDSVKYHRLQIVGRVESK